MSLGAFVLAFLSTL